MTEPRSPLSLARVLTVVLPVAVIGLALYWWSSTLATTARQRMESNVIGRMFSAEPVFATTKMSFPDADQDMVADPPSEPGQTISPDVLVFSYIATEEEGPPANTWDELLAALKEKTGKDVQFVEYTSADEQLAALRKGELHITGLNTGIVPVAVARDGFVPLCTLGREDGSFGYTMEFIVPADSKIKSPADIKGHKLTFTRLDSNSGCKAPLVLLMNQFNLKPERDYEYGFSAGHEDSIRRVAEKEFEVAPVASDILANMIEKGEVDKAAIRSIHTSEPFPPATLGYVYNLAPELRDAVRETIVDFSWAGTGLEKEFSPETTKFVPVNYKNDWADIRRIDEAIAESRRPSAT